MVYNSTETQHLIIKLMYNSVSMICLLLFTVRSSFLCLLIYL